ncbi:uncharacterized protein LOC112523587 [Cynara cardunculus var. scolymus]|uniref:uncharacterized protein LOC112523587 n=1 Tax=Cynara cardunculus var. scolymus TaxID=59895 RepID=UPI000D6283DC|nr:uncharacterized protein LOC112523587 [Cynara cardunculus var. scolymus]
MPTSSSTKRVLRSTNVDKKSAETNDCDDEPSQLPPPSTPAVANGDALKTRNRQLRRLSSLFLRWSFVVGCLRLRRVSGVPASPHVGDLACYVDQTPEYAIS